MTHVKDVHLVRATQIKPFWDTLTKMGAPVRRLASQSGLPIQSVRSGRGVIGEHALWRFLDFAAEQLGQPLLGYHCDKSHPITANILDHCSPSVDSLQRLLEDFIVAASYEYTGTWYRLEPANQGSWFRRAPIFTGPQSSWQIEQFFFASMFRIMRTCAGANWLPPAITVNSKSKPTILPDEWRSIDVDWGHPVTSIFIPADDLAAAPLSPSIGRCFDPANTRRPRTPQFWELVRRQVVWGGVGLRATADECGLTEITLQRWLRKRGTSYSRVVEQERSKRAKELLRTDRSITDISASLGYRHPENFCRAFSRMTGASPSAYRSQHR